MDKRDATGGHGAVGGAVHEGVRATLEDLVEGASATGDDGDSGEGLEESDVKWTDAAAEATEIEACSRSDKDHEGDTEFEEGGVVGEEGGGGLGYCGGGREDLIGCRGGGHITRITRLGE